MESAGNPASSRPSRIGLVCSAPTRTTMSHASAARPPKRRFSARSSLPSSTMPGGMSAEYLEGGPGALGIGVVGVVDDDDPRPLVDDRREAVLGWSHPGQRSRDLAQLESGAVANRGGSHA